MKARVKETGEIVEVREEYDLREAFVQVFYSNEEDPYEVYEKEELDFNLKDDNTPNYWTRLEHQYAGMAMQGLLSSGKLNIIVDNSDVLPEGIAIVSRDFAHALVEKIKEIK